MQRYVKFAKMNILEIKKQHKLRGHCHYTGKYRVLNIEYVN